MRERIHTLPDRPTPPARFDLIIFDCDGVLVDSETISLRTLLATLISHGATVDLDYVRTTYLGRSFPTVAADFLRLTGRLMPAGFEADFLARLFEAYRSDLRAIDGVSALISALPGKRCVATSSAPERATFSLRLTGLDGFFRDAIFTASMVARGKPAPDLFLYAARACGADPARCLVIEDSEVGVAAALAAGMTVWRFVGGSHFAEGIPPSVGAALPARTFTSMREIAAELAPD